MKALTLTQPWATGVVMGYKQVETRSWRTNYRGVLAIHAAKGFPKEAKEFLSSELLLGRLTPWMPLGAVLCTARLVNCVPTERLLVDDLERLYGDYSSGRWAWLLEDVQPLAEPILAKGSLGLWEWTP